MGQYYSSENILQMLDGNKEEVRELALMLFDLGPIMIDEIESFISSENYESAGDTAHKLKSSLKLWKMTELAEIAFFIETNGRANTEIELIKTKFEILKRDFNIALEEMKTEFI